MDHSWIIFIAVIINYVCADRGRLHMLISPISVSMPINDEAILECKMNINADSFIWHFFPLPSSQANNPKTIIQWDAIKPVEISKNMYQNDKKSSKLYLKSQNSSIAGDYQCIPYYGASAIASPPGRITMTHLGEFPKLRDINLTVSPGNTITYRCEPPDSNPPAYIDYYKDKNHITLNANLPKTQSLILYNVSVGDTGVYSCSASNIIESRRVDADYHLNLKVVNNSPPQTPHFILPPKSVYYVNKGDEVFFECSAIGTPVPTITWQKINGALPTKRTEMFPGGLRIFNVTKEDDGIYVCKHANTKGLITHNITLKYREVPSITEGLKNTNMSEGESMDLECIVEGIPLPKVSWLLNGKSVVNDTAIEINDNRISFLSLQKRHAGFLQCFAHNEVGIKFSLAELRVIPKQIPSTDFTDDYSTRQPVHKRRKTNKKGKPISTAQMIPPSKPTVTRLSDESVVVRWTVPSNSGLPIQFFKVQYQELGPYNSNITIRPPKWKTSNADIPPNIRSYEVDNLKPEQVYKFRIAAVYSNNDNKLSPKSDKFHLNRTDFFMKNPLPVPKLVHTERINSTAIKIEWEYAPIPNITIDGFFINYVSASSAEDYMKATVDGDSVNSYVITHLKPNTVYDIKIQSFTSKSASEFSPILKQSTAHLVLESPSTTTIPSTNVEQEFPIIYVVIGVALIAVVITIVVIYLVCRKCKCDNNMNDRNHHYPSDGGDYPTSRTYPRTNGVNSNARMTITSNPLADADNKNQNVMEMSCLSIQNNNCSTTESTPATTEQSTTANNVNITRDTEENDTLNKKKKTNNKKRNDVHRENYV